jgi:hypothetical protein
MISFLSPLFLAGALTVAVPILLHLLKREPEARLKFSAVKLLRRAPVEHTRRRHLNELLLLLLRVAALLFLAVAFARPFFASGAASASSGVTIVALDISLSLSAPGQFDKARALARQAIANAASNDLVGVVTFADAAQVVARPSGDRALATAAIDAAVPGFGGTRYRAALHAAAGLVDGGGGTIIVVTDMQGSGWDEGDRASVPESARIEVADVGAPPPNLAVISARAAGDRVVAVVRNSGAEPREARVQLTVDGRQAGEAAATVGGLGSAEVLLAGARGRDAVATVDDVDGDRGLQADNTRYLVLDNRTRPAVLVVTARGDLERDAFYLRHAIVAAGSGSGGSTYGVEGVGGSQLSSWDRARLDRYGSIALVSTRGLERNGRDLLSDYVRRGGGVLLAAGPDVDADVAAGALGGVLSLIMPARSDRERERTLAPADVRHPVFQAFGPGATTLGLVKFRRVAAMRGDGCQALARFTTGEPALVECAAGDGRVLAIASDLNNGWNDFPLHPTFVPFVHEAVRYLSGGRFRAGEYLVADVPAGVPARPGFVTLPGGQAGTGAGARVAVNVDPAESDPERLTLEEFQAAVTRVKDVSRAADHLEARQQEDRQHVWQYVLGLMVAMLALESVVGARTS